MLLGYPNPSGLSTYIFDFAGNLVAVGLGVALVRIALRGGTRLYRRGKSRLVRINLARPQPAGEFRFETGIARVIVGVLGFMLVLIGAIVLLHLTALLYWSPREIW